VNCRKFKRIYHKW